ncbi:MAG: signal protein PDZ [Phototrophicales bacterium]|nr:MAG: signal protein PDZ [Phototrophicales bacterium]
MSHVLEQFSQALADIVQLTDTSVVRIDARRRLPATGIIWSAEGVIVTAHHVVERDDNIHVTLADGNTIPAQLVGRAPEVDLAILRVETQELTAANWGDLDELRVGHLVLALGKAGQNIQATLGIVSAIGEVRENAMRRPMHRRRVGERFIRTDVVMYPGFSGGPLVDAIGVVRGMNTSVMGGVSIAIPTATIRETVEMLLSHGRIKRGYLGITTQPIALPEEFRVQLNQESGLLIIATEPNSPAANAGLVLGDVLVRLDGESISIIDDLMSMLTNEYVGKTVAAQILRAGKLEDIQLTIGERS